MTGKARLSHSQTSRAHYPSPSTLTGNRKLKMMWSAHVTRFVTVAMTSVVDDVQQLLLMYDTFLMRMQRIPRLSIF
jgi:hypothetical protein